MVNTHHYLIAKIFGQVKLLKIAANFLKLDYYYVYLFIEFQPPAALQLFYNRTALSIHAMPLNYVPRNFCWE